MHGHVWQRFAPEFFRFPFTETVAAILLRPRLRPPLGGWAIRLGGVSRAHVVADYQQAYQDVLGYQQRKDGRE